MEYFIFNGTNSNDLGIVVRRMPPITAPKKDIETLRVDGRNGNYHIDNDTYESYNVTLECAVTDMTKINNIKSTLTGMGTIEFSTVPNVEYECVIKNQVSMDTYLNVLRSFLLILELNPIGYSKTETTETIVADGTFNVGGTIGVKPIIEVTGSGSATITINNVAFTLDNLDATPTIVDCDLMNVTKNGLQANTNFTGNFPSLVVGENAISIVGTITQINIKYKEGWL